MNSAVENPTSSVVKMSKDIALEFCSYFMSNDPSIFQEKNDKIFDEFLDNLANEFGKAVGPEEAAREYENWIEFYYCCSDDDLTLEVEVTIPQNVYHMASLLWLKETKDVASPLKHEKLGNFLAPLWFVKYEIDLDEFKQCVEALNEHCASMNDPY